MIRKTKQSKFLVSENYFGINWIQLLIIQIWFCLQPRPKLFQINEGPPQNKWTIKATESNISYSANCSELHGPLWAKNFWHLQPWSEGLSLGWIWLPNDFMMVSALSLGSPSQFSTSSSISTPDSSCWSLWQGCPPASVQCLQALPWPPRTLI